jgi:hypothetical protein
MNLAVQMRRRGAGEAVATEPRLRTADGALCARDVAAAAPAQAARLHSSSAAAPPPSTARAHVQNKLLKEINRVVALSPEDGKEKAVIELKKGMSNWASKYRTNGKARCWSVCSCSDWMSVFV